ncbi:phospholipid-transporting ATPase ABCA3-like [Amblyomma americanum]
MHPIILDVNGVGYELLIMLMEAVLLFCLLGYWDSGHHFIRPSASASSPAAPSSKLDEDVRREREEVQRLRGSKLFRERALLAENLHKWYGSLHAVRGLSFTVQPQECLGLLGVNGSGKTSTFQMLTALLPPTRGDAYMDDLVLSREPRKWQARLGYCMQYGGLVDSLTACEFLRLFARLRGVPSKDVKSLVEGFIHLVGLEEDANRLCGTYSGGGKRKLSIAAALIGLPRLVFLDEPTAGVDVVAKARIFAALADIMAYSGIAVVLTSHSSILTLINSMYSPCL